MAKLATSPCPPRIQVAIGEDCHGVSLPTSNLLHLLLLQCKDQLGLWLVWTAILILRHG